MTMDDFDKIYVDIQGDQYRLSEYLEAPSLHRIKNIVINLSRFLSNEYKFRILSEISTILGSTREPQFWHNSRLEKIPSNHLIDWFHGWEISCEWLVTHYFIGDSILSKHNSCNEELRDEVHTLLVKNIGEWLSLHYLFLLDAEGKSGIDKWASYPPQIDKGDAKIIKEIFEFYRSFQPPEWFKKLSLSNQEELLPVPLDLLSEQQDLLSKQLDLLYKLTSLIKYLIIKKWIINQKTRDLLKSLLIEINHENYTLAVDYILKIIEEVVITESEREPIESDRSRKVLVLECSSNVGSDLPLVPRYLESLTSAIKREIKKIAVTNGKKLFKISVAHPKFLTKRFDSPFVIQVYFDELKSDVIAKIEAIIGKNFDENSYDTELMIGQVIKIYLHSPTISFSEPIIKNLNSPSNLTTFLAKPLDDCHPGNHNVILSILDNKTGIEFKSEMISVKVVDFAFDHISRPLLSKVSTFILGIGSFAMFVLSFLEQIDKTIGLTSGTAAAVLAAAVYANFYNTFQRVRSNTP